MKLANAIEGGITGITTLTLLQEALRKVDHDAPRPLLHKSGIVKQLKKNKKKGGHHTTKDYIKLATELLTSLGAFGFIGLGKKKNVLLRGGLLGAAAGLGAAFLPDNQDKENDEVDGKENGRNVNGNPFAHLNLKDDPTKEQLLTVALYTAGGLLAGAAIKHFGKVDKKLKKKSKQLKLKKIAKKKQR